MQIHYCQTCSKLIPPALIDSGQVKVQEEKPVFCLECNPPPASAQRAMRSTPSSGAQRNMRSTPADGSQRNIRNLPIPARGSPSKGNRVLPPSAQSGTRLRAPSDRTTSQQNTPMLIVGLVIGGIVVLGLIIMALGGAKQPHTPVKKKTDTKVADAGKTDDGTERDFRGPGFLTPAPKPKDTGAKSVRGRYVRIELPGDRRILSLAEVEVFSGDENVASKGKATQSSTTNGGAPERAIDGNKSGAFDNNSITHTDEELNPWWELDLGEDCDIRKIVVWNRDEQNLGARLKDFNLSILDAKRTVVWRKDKIPAPEPYYMLFPK
jgi:hypothetical protein